MTRESVLGSVDRHVRVAHGGATYVRLPDPHGIVVGVSDTQLLVRDPCVMGDEPRAWLAAIAEVIGIDGSDTTSLS